MSERHVMPLVPLNNGKPDRLLLHNNIIYLLPESFVKMKINTVTEILFQYTTINHPNPRCYITKL